VDLVDAFSLSSQKSGLMFNVDPIFSRSKDLI
jgi:hypothetical protein